MSVRVVLLLLLVSSAPVTVTAPGALATIGVKILGAVGSKLAGLAFEKGLQELGILPDNGIDSIATEINNLRVAVEDLDSKLDLLNYRNSYRDAVAATVPISTQQDVVKEWQRINYKPTTQSEVQDVWQKMLTSVRLFKQAHLVNQETGVIPLFMKLDRYATVSDQHEYHADLETLRSFFASTIASAVVTLETLARILITNVEECTTTLPDNDNDNERSRRSLETVITYEGMDASACRYNTDNAGGPDDPIVQANNMNNVYFDVSSTAFSLTACQNECTANSACTGVEFGTADGRCELWKVNIGWMKPSSGFGCYRKVVTEVNDEPPTSAPVDNPCNLPYYSDELINDFFLEAKAVVLDMYSFGVPLWEARNPNQAKFVHVRNQPWALSPPNIDFSGYFATATYERLGTKLATLTGNYDPNHSEHNGKTLETFLRDNGIPTVYIAQETWECGAIGGIGCQGDCGYILSVNILYISGNSYSFLPTTIYWGVYSFASDCNSDLNDKKNDAGQDYNAALDSGGLYMGTYYQSACYDTDVCFQNELVTNPVTVNARYFGRFFTYNLKVDDCDRMCLTEDCTYCGIFEYGCTYCGDRLDVGGRPMLKQEVAVKDYLEWDERSSGPGPVPGPLPGVPSAAPTPTPTPKPSGDDNDNEDDSDDDCKSGFFSKICVIKNFFKNIFSKLFG